MTELYPKIAFRSPVRVYLGYSNYHRVKHISPNDVSNIV